MTFQKIPHFHTHIWKYWKLHSLVRSSWASWLTVRVCNVMVCVGFSMQMQRRSSVEMGKSCELWVRPDEFVFCVTTAHETSKWVLRFSVSIFFGSTKSFYISLSLVTRVPTQPPAVSLLCQHSAFGVNFQCFETFHTNSIFAVAKNWKLMFSVPLVKNPDYVKVKQTN